MSPPGLKSNPEENPRSERSAERKHEEARGQKPAEAPQMRTRRSPSCAQPYSGSFVFTASLLGWYYFY